jgi:hypothetical protein
MNSWDIAIYLCKSHEHIITSLNYSLFIKVDFGICLLHFLACLSNFCGAYSVSAA